MEREQPSRDDLRPETGVLDSEMAVIATSIENVQKSAQLQFSTIAARVDNLVAVALSIPDLRRARVRALQARIAAGTYQVPAEQVAESLFENMQASWKAGGHRQSFGA